MKTLWLKIALIALTAFLGNGECSSGSRLESVNIAVDATSVFTWKMLSFLIMSSPFLLIRSASGEVFDKLNNDILSPSSHKLYRFDVDTGEIYDESVIPDSPTSSYTYYHGLGYYKFYSTKKSWYDAWTTCYNDNAKLVVINSEAERNVIKDLVASPYLTIVGFHSLVNKDRIFVTVNGERLANLPFMEWNAGEPNNYLDLNEVCGSISPSGRLNDCACDEKWPFICEL